MTDGGNSRRSTTIDRRNVLKLGGAALTAGSVGAAGCVSSTGDGGSSSSSGSGGEYPSNSIKWIVPYSTGGGFDTYSRGLAEYMPQHLPNEPEIAVENRSGAGGRRGANAIYRADPDGYTIGIFNVPGMIATQIISETEYNLSKVSWIGRIARTQYTVAVAQDSEYQSIEDLQNAEQVKAAVTGMGSTSTLATVIAMNELNINTEIVSGYEGSSEALTSVIRGDTDLRVTDFNSVRTQVENGDMRLLAAFSEKPPEYAPDTPTAADIGNEKLAGLVSMQRVIGGPPGIDDAKLDTLEKGLLETAKSEEFKQWAQNQERPIDAAGRDEVSKIIQDSQSTFSKYEDLLKDKLQE